MDNLKPCPFCGGEATTSHGVAGMSGRYFFVSCEKCQSKTRRFLRGMMKPNKMQLKLGTPEPKGE